MNSLMGDSVASPLVWGITLVVTVAALFVDIVVIARRPHEPSMGEASRHLAFFVGLAVEPMITLGTKDTVVLDDDWTVITGDGSWAAHFEHTFTLTPRGAWVLTALDGGEAALTALGVPFGGA